MFRKLPPAGNPILLNKNYLDDQSLAKIFPGWVAKYYGSGAMAIAVALKAIFFAKHNLQREVLIPAYSCPELLSAILYAGGRPVLVDLEEGKPWICLDDLQSKITNQTAVAIAVDLLGIPERIKKIQNILSKHNIVLIEDSAQYMPRSPNKLSWLGDLIILSFGRGKPVSVLGGGAVLFRKESFENIDLELQSQPIARNSIIGRQWGYCKLYLYNRLIEPKWYWIPSGLPFMHLGKTRFKKMTKIRPLETTQANLLKSNLEHYWNTDNENAKKIKMLLGEINANKFTDLTNLPGVKLDELLRYPILIKDPNSRLKFIKLANEKGLGVTDLYRTDLSSVPGGKNKLRLQGSYIHASRFASQLVTLPVHPYVRNTDIANMAQLLAQAID